MAVISLDSCSRNAREFLFGPQLAISQRRNKLKIDAIACISIYLGNKTCMNGPKDQTQHKILFEEKANKPSKSTEAPKCISRLLERG